MKLDINQDWRIRTEDINVILQRRRAEAKHGKTRKAETDPWTNVGYYPNLEQACLAALRKIPTDAEGVDGLQTILATIKATEARLIEALREAKATSAA